MIAVPPDSPRILELRRRVQADPASIAFAQLAEEYRRAGSFAEAIRTCRTGLARHPGYLSARVTLGRALIETGALDEAATEFELVLRSAPDNLAAIRGMAEIYQRRGQLQEALDLYKRALDLARNDPDLEETVANIGRELGNVGQASSSAGLSFDQAQSELLSFASRFESPPEAPPAPQPPAPAAMVDPPPTTVPTPAADAGTGSSTPAGPLRADVIEPAASEARGDDDANDSGSGMPTVAEPASHASVRAAPLVDFDDILRQLGAPDATPPPLMNALIGSAPVPTAPPVSPAPAAPPAASEQGRRLTDVDRRTTADAHPAAQTTPAPAPAGAERDREVLQELEDWLRTLQDERTRRESSEP
jgi:tetratricopeptide (TPR) repeat protein